MKTTIKSVFLIVLVIFCNCKDDEDPNPTTGTISGRITDATTGLAIEGTNVQTQPVTNQVSSNNDGDYSITNVVPGQYVVEAEKSNFNPATINVSVAAGATTSADIALTSTLNDGLIAHFPFNGNANDESGNGNNGTVQGAALTIDRFDSENSAYNFDGIDDIIDIGNSVKPNFPFTISTWINIEDTNHGPFGQGTIFRNDFWNHTARYNGFQLVHSKGQLIGLVGNGGIAAQWSRSDFITTEEIFSEATWYHVLVVVLAHNDMRFFIDGAEYESSSNGGTASSMVYSASSPGAIGFSVDTQFIGKLDDIRVYDRALSDDEIKALSQEGT